MRNLITNAYFAYLVVIINIVFSAGTFTSLMIQQLHYTNEISTLRTEYEELNRMVQEHSEVAKNIQTKVNQIHKQHP